MYGEGKSTIDDDSNSNSSSSSDTSIQIGNGVNLDDDSFIGKLALLVSKKIQQNPVIPNEVQHFNLQPPSTTLLTTPNSTPALKFDHKIVENDKNDSFDEKRLLKFVPKDFKSKARLIIKKFNENPEEITFSSDGTIFIAQTSIAESNIYTYFPFLFKSRRPKTLHGFDDFLRKINEMGLSHLIKGPVYKSHVKTNKPSLTSTSPNVKSNWWYLGP